MLRSTLPTLLDQIHLYSGGIVLFIQGLVLVCFRPGGYHHLWCTSVADIHTLHAWRLILLEIGILWCCIAFERI
ncbi:hypothetical protein DFH27DRAFT_577535 [Peziza echinospora]|nr:hypothetical protein DFH27DRAFT_577535 [Peziza echinospora]